MLKVTGRVLLLVRVGVFCSTRSFRSFRSLRSFPVRYELGYGMGRLAGARFSLPNTKRPAA